MESPMFQLTTGMMLLGIAAGADAAPTSQPAIQYDLAALKRQGAFGFPQPAAETLCDTDDLRVSIWNNKTYLYVQAILWKDGDAAWEEAPGTGGRSGTIHSCASTWTPTRRSRPRWTGITRMNPWPVRPGLHIQSTWATTAPPTS